MSYAPLPRADKDEDLELAVLEADKLIADHDQAGPSSSPRSPAWDSARKRLLIRQPNARVVVGCAIGFLFVAGVWVFAPSSRILGAAQRFYSNSQRYSTDWRQRPQLSFVRVDGETIDPLNNASIAKWPEAYPHAAKYLRDNGVLPDIVDPWPDKPWIAGIWLAAERFPDGLGGQPHDPTWLPEVGKEDGRRPSPGLHDPPLPNFPQNEGNFKRIAQVPRESQYQATYWKPPRYGMGRPKQLPNVQASDFPTNEDQLKLTRARRDWVQRAFLHSWEGYKAHAFGHDEISPVSRGLRDSYNAWGASTVDNLDTLLMMGLNHEYNLARTHVRSLDFSMVTKPGTCNGTEGPEVHLFETVIRYLGGFLSAYDLSGDGLMLDRAKELAEWLLPAFTTSSGFPIAFYKLGENPGGSRAPQSLIAEAGSLSMELTRLSQLTGDDTYFNAAQRITDRLATFKTIYGSLLPVVVSDTGPAYGAYSIGGMIDSYYEYLIKMVALLGDDKGIYSTMYQRAVKDMYKWLVVNVTVPMSSMSDRPGTVIIGSRPDRAPLKAEQQHLSTFAGGMFGLGSQLLQDPDQMSLAVELTDSAIWAYQSTATGLMPEIVTFYHPQDSQRWEYATVDNEDMARQRGIPVGSASQGDVEYMGRPETIESVFYMYRITGDPAWQDQGWRMFTAWMRHALTPVGFANIANVNNNPAKQIDIQESFVLAETLKYYYLLFSEPDLINLNDYVFNTEAHPLLRPGRSKRLLWKGPEIEVDRTYADPRDKHLFKEGASQKLIPFGRGTAKQQTWRSTHCV